MKGFQVHRKAGWDTHGLPVELGVEKELGITKADIDNKESDKYISVGDYNHKCRENVMKFTAEWRKLTEQMGYFVDLDHPYITYDNKYIETLWWLLKQLYNKGLLYKGYTIQPYSPAAGTGLSSHELNQPGCYRDVKDTTATAMFRIVNPKSEWMEWGTPYFAAWTTTPWTLPSNTALCVGPNIKYVAVQTYNTYNDEPITVIMAEARLGAYLKPEGAEMPMDGYAHGDKVVPYRIVGAYTGSELVGIKYAQLMPWVKPCMKLDVNSPAYVKEYAETHPGKVFDGENGKERFVEFSENAFRVILVTMSRLRTVQVLYILHRHLVPMMPRSPLRLTYLLFSLLIRKEKRVLWSTLKENIMYWMSWMLISLQHALTQSHTAIMPAILSRTHISRSLPSTGNMMKRQQVRQRISISLSVWK